MSCELVCTFVVVVEVISDVFFRDVFVVDFLGVVRASCGFRVRSGFLRVRCVFYCGEARFVG